MQSDVVRFQDGQKVSFVNPRTGGRHVGTFVKELKQRGCQIVVIHDLVRRKLYCVPVNDVSEVQA